MNLLNDHRVQELLAAAVAAPSADNHHPWQLQIHERRLSLICPSLVGAPSTRWILALVSMGAVVESMVMRGRRLGLGLELRLSLARRDAPISLDVVECAAEPDPLDAAIESRCSNRSMFYRGPQLHPTQQALLSAENQGLAGAMLEWQDRAESRRAACRLVQLAETERFRNPELHAELFGSVRFDVGWLATADQGLPPAALGVAWAERPMFSAMRHWPMQRLLNCFGAHHLLGARSAGLPSRWAPHLCTINAVGEPEQGAVIAGRLLQRVWCRASLMGLSSQVLAAAAVYALPDATAIDANLQRRLAAGWADLALVGRPFVVIRMGYARPAALRAGRPPAKSLRAAGD